MTPSAFRPIFGALDTLVYCGGTAIRARRFRSSMSMGCAPCANISEAGVEAVQNFLNEAGVPPKTITMYDGSGLSRHNLITASATAQLYEYMSKHRYAKDFYDALPVGGVDGTLRNRFKNTPAANNVRAKTGTINQVAALSGYVVSAAGERFVFSILVNNYPDDSLVRRRAIDDIVVLLAACQARAEK